MYRRLWKALIAGTTLALLWNAIAVGAVWTDQADYSPGSVVTVSGGRPALTPILMNR